MFAFLLFHFPLSLSFLNTLMWISIIYRSGPYPHKNSHAHTHTPLSPEERGVTRSMWPAARLGRPSLPWRRVAVGAAVVPFGQTAVQNVLDVLDNQVDGH